MFSLAILIGLIAPYTSKLQSIPAPQKRTLLEIQFSGAAHGVVDIALYLHKAPKTCAQIINLTNSGFYDRQKVFKVINSPRPFLVQMGDPLTKLGLTNPEIGTGGSGVKVPYENSGIKMTKGTVVLATRPGDPNSGDSQFFILLGDYQNLLGKSATVFGSVVKGLKIVEKLQIGDEIDSARIIAPHS